MNIAFLCSPSPYGLFSVYRALRAGLAGTGATVRWVGHGRWAVDDSADPQFAAEHAHGTIVGPDSTDFDHLGKLLVEHLSTGYDAVIINPPQDQCQMNVVRYLPKRVKRVLIVHSTAGGAVRPLADLRAHLHAAVGVSPASRELLVRLARFDPARTVTIPNGLDLSPFAVPLDRPSAGPLRLLSFGRLEEQSKGIFWLPAIMQKLADLDVRLTIAGQGPQEAELRRRCAALGDRVSFAGLVPRMAIPRLIADHDVFVLPSRNEGLPYALIEAMAGGCAAVVSRLPGVTDFIIRDGESGLLFEVGDVNEAAAQVRKLATDPPRRAALSAAARADVHERFSAAAMGRAYLQLLQTCETHPIADPLPLSDWHYPKSFRHGIGHYLPGWLKTIVKRFR